MKVLAVTNTIEFQNRATFEAIQKNYGCLDVLVKRHIKDFFKKKFSSDILNVKYIHSLIPESWQKYPLFKKIELSWLRLITKNIAEKYDLFLYCNTHVCHMTHLFNGKKKWALFVDPYTIMTDGETTEQEKEWLENTEAVLCTSKQLASRYIKKYLRIEDYQAYYWPNTVNLREWDIDSLPQPVKLDKVICGYAGNMNEITIDLDLVDFITRKFPDLEFRFAGNLNFKKDSDTVKMQGFFARDNVKYLGFIPYKMMAREVNNWDICLMLDTVYELSCYVHHNKIYQYLALGKPVIATKTHSDYNELSSVVWEAGSHKEFINAIQEAIQEIEKTDRRLERVKVARANSSDARAWQFVKIIQGHYKNKEVAI